VLLNLFFSVSVFSCNFYLYCWCNIVAGCQLLFCPTYCRAAQFCLSLGPKCSSFICSAFGLVLVKCKRVSWIGEHMKLTSNGYRHTWAWKEMQPPTKKPSEGACFHSHPTSLQPPKLLNGTNRVSLRIGTSAIRMPESIEYLQAVNTANRVGNGIGPETSASW